MTNAAAGDAAGPRPSDPPEDRSRTRLHEVGVVWIGALIGIVVLCIVVVPERGATPLWLDEAYSLGVLSQFAFAVRHTGGTMVAFYAPLWVWAHVSESTTWLRTLPLVFACAVMPVVAGIGRRIGGSRLALAAPALLAGSFMFQWLSIELRAYSLESLILCTSFFALIRAVQEGTDTEGAHRWWVLLTLVAPWGVFAHGLFPIFLAAIGVAALLSPKPKAAVVAIIPMLGAAGVLTALLFWMGISHVGDWVQVANPAYLKYTAFRYLGLHHVVQLVTGFLVVAAVWSGIRARRNARDATYDGRVDAWVKSVPVAWFVVPTVSLLLISLVRPEFIDRYLSAIAPGLALTIGLGLVATADVVRARFHLADRQAVVAFGLAAVVLVAGMTWVDRDGLRKQPHDHWDTIARIVADEVEPGDGILFFSDFSRPAFEHEWLRTRRRTAPRVLNMPRQLGAPRRYYFHEPVTYPSRRRLLAFERIWTIAVTGDEVADPFYAATPPLATNYRVVRTWRFFSLRGPVTMRLYERVTPVDFFPANG